jgi:hypothetical protein
MCFVVIIMYVNKQKRAMTTILILYVYKYWVWIINNNKILRRHKILYKYKRVCLLHPLNYNRFIWQKKQARGERISYKHDIYLWIINNGKIARRHKILCKYQRVFSLHLSHYNSFILQKWNQVKGERILYKHDIYLNK